VICVNYSQRRRGTRWRDAAESLVVARRAIRLRTRGGERSAHLAGESNPLCSATAPCVTIGAGTIF
jgi:hypothetical protein